MARINGKLLVMMGSEESIFRLLIEKSGVCRLSATMEMFSDFIHCNKLMSLPLADGRLMQPLLGFIKDLHGSVIMCELGGCSITEDQEEHFRWPSRSSSSLSHLFGVGFVSSTSPLNPICCHTPITPESMMSFLTTFFF